MKTIICLLIFTACVNIAISQTINYERSFSQAKAKSLAQNKPLAILIIHDSPKYSSMFNALQNVKVVAAYNQNFINHRLNPADTAALNIMKEYNITHSPSFLFLDSKAGPLLRYYGILTIPDTLISLAGRVVAAGKEKSLVDYDREYKAGSRDRAFFESYINKRKQAGITSNAKLIDEYVDQLTVSDLNRYSEVLFILKAGPIIDGKAYKLAHTNQKIIDSIYKTEPLDERIAMNNVMTANTMIAATTEKDVQKAYSAARHTLNSWGSNYKEGQKNFHQKMVQYYWAVKDTASYLQQASDLYDSQYMNVSVDSLKKMEKQTNEEAKKAAMEKAKAMQPKGSKKPFSFVVPLTNNVNTYSTELNNAAYSFYMTGTRKPEYLTKALLWSKRSIELKPMSAYYDTLAHLLYRLGFYAEAENTQLKAVELAKTEQANVKQMQDELLKIRNRTL